MSKCLAICLLMIVVASSRAHLVFENENEDQTAAIQAVLNKQVKAWNQGDIPGFMDGYVRGDKLRFASGDSVTYGWQQTLDRYQKSYTDQSKMGTLTFADVQVLILSDDYAEVFGRWHLAREKAVGDAKGRFTLLMKRTSNGWRIFHDHTSSAKAAE